MREILRRLGRRPTFAKVVSANWGSERFGWIAQVTSTAAGVYQSREPGRTRSLDALATRSKATIPRS